MSDDLDLESRLRSLGELSPPTSPLLDCETMHVGASRMQRRQQLMVAIPSILLVVVVLASAVVLRNNQGGLLDSAGNPATGTAAPVPLTARDRELLDVTEAAIRLRRELLLESLDAATYATINRTTDVKAQRTRTDAALTTFEDRVESIDPGRDSQQVKDALKQFDNRAKSLTTIRRAVDVVQTDAARLTDEYAMAAIDLASVQRAILQSVDNPPLFRGLWTLKNLGEVTTAEARTASLLTIAVELGYFAAVLPASTQITPAKNNPLGEGCGDDAAGGGDQCKLYKDAVAHNSEAALAERDFDDFATGAQKKLIRFGDADLKYSELSRHAFEDGQGHNDLRGTQPGTTPVPVDEWRSASRDRVNTRIDTELKTLDEIRRLP